MLVSPQNPNGLLKKTGDTLPGEPFTARASCPQLSTQYEFRFTQRADSGDHYTVQYRKSPAESAATLAPPWENLEVMAKKGGKEYTADYDVFAYMSHRFDENSPIRTGEDMTATQKHRLQALQSTLKAAETEQTAYSDALATSPSVPLGQSKTEHRPSLVNRNDSEKALRIHNEIDLHRFQERSSIQRHAHWEKTLLRTANAALEQSGAHPMIMHATEQENANPIVDEPLFIITPHSVFGTHGPAAWTQIQAFVYEAENSNFHTNINSLYGRRLDGENSPIPWNGRQARDAIISNAATTPRTDLQPQASTDNDTKIRPLPKLSRSSTFTPRGDPRGWL